MTPLVSLGAILAKEAIPHLFGKLGKRGTGAERVAEAVADMALDLTGSSASAPVEDVTAALAADPAAYAQVKEQATRLAIAELEAETRSREIGAQDRASARSMRSERDARARIQLVWAALAFNVVILSAILFSIYAQFPSYELILTMLGTSQGGGIMLLKQAYDYWFGTSNGSDLKNYTKGSGFADLP